MGRYLKILGLLVCLARPALAQHILFERLTPEEKGDKLIRQFAYKAAIDEYMKALEGQNLNDTLRLKIAESFRLKRDPSSALKWYAQINDGLMKPEHKLHYAQVLTSAGKYEEAKNWYAKFNDDSPGDQTINRAIESFNHLDDFYRDSASYRIDTISFNSPTDDFGPAFYYTGIVFVSGRDRTGIVNQRVKGNSFNFLDLYFNDFTGTNEAKQLFGEKINSRLHEGPMIFYSDYNKLIFTCDNLKYGSQGKSSDDIIKLQLYYTERIFPTSVWTEPKSLPFNSKEYSTAHPAISKDGTVLYFVSDKPGGFGGADIYKSILISGIWSTAENLGQQVNTSGDEMFPFLHQDSVLYFASTGLGGLGGLDIFSYDLSSQSLKNMGYPLNSRFDDFGLIMASSGKSGYLSSNRHGESHDDDIYKFAKVSRDVLVKAFDSDTKLPLDSVSMKADSHEWFTGSNGELHLNLNPGTYHYGFSKLNYESTTISSSQDKVIVWMKPLVFDLLGTITSRGDGSPLEGVMITLVDTSSLDSSVVITDKAGHYQFPLQPGKAYKVWASKKSCGVDRIEITTNGLSSSQTLSGNMELICTGDIIAVENIYYDLGSYFIRDDAAKELDSLVNIMNQYLDMRIELRSHTDSRASAPYNMKLSTQRAQAVLDYMAEHGVLPSRMRARGMGETTPLNNCTDGSKCSEDEYQQNRRTEFKVLSITN